MVYLGGRDTVLLKRTPLFSECRGYLRLARGVGKLGTDGHIAKFGIEHLFLGVGEPVLLAAGLVTHEDIDEDEHDDERDERVLIADGFAAEHVSVEPGLYVVIRCHYFFSAIRSLALRARGLRATSSGEASRPFSMRVKGERLLP